MGAPGRDIDVLQIPVGQLQKGDEFHMKGMRFTLWSMEQLEERKPQPAFNSPAGWLMRLTGESENYQAVLILDSRLVLNVFREVPVMVAQVA